MVLQSSVKHGDGPPSPTLTNPDMILPYTAEARLPSLSPPRQGDRHNSPPEAVIGETTHRFHSQNETGNTADWGNITPRNSPPLSSYGSGTTLPDIEEKETTPKLGRWRPSSFERQSPRPFHRSFPVMEEHAQATAYPYSKRFSNCSSSAASEDFDFGQWDSFDGAASVDGESLFQDEEEDYKSPVTKDEAYPSADRPDGAHAEVADMIRRREEALSSAALSKRAERILASAKKRLTTMEGNLSRARHSLMVSPTSPSLSSSESMDAPPEIPQHLSGITERTMSPAKHRQLPSALPSSSGSPGHSRVFSETSVPSSLHTTPQSLRHESESQRASSAMGSVGMTPRLKDQYGSKSLVTKDRSRDEIITHSVGLTSRHQKILLPLNEEESISAAFPPAKSVSASPEQEAGQSVSSSSAIESRFPTNTSLTRSRSTMQMRDLREQMQDLKGKISTLKERARRDNMRRRSMQSLRTPSPFTAANPWHTGAEMYRMGQQTTNTGFGPDELPSPLESDEERKSETADESLNGGGREDVRRHQAREDAHSVAQSHYENAREQIGDEDDTFWDDEDATHANEPNGYHQRNGAGGDEVEEDSILDDQSFYESSPSPMGERHEDRADAFDYEHFFLRSDLGSYDRSTHRRRNSYGSTDSVETTKGPTVLENPSNEQAVPVQALETSHTRQLDFGRQKGHHRNNSVDSVSTFATFATATEGRGSDVGSDADEEEWEQHQRQHPMAGTWKHDYFSHQTSATVPGMWSNKSPPILRPDSAIRVNGHLTPGSPNGSSNPAPSRSFPLVNKPRHLTPSPSPQPPSALVSALMAQVRPDDGTTRPTLQLSKEDGDLVERLLESLGKVCLQLRGDREGATEYEGRVWRRRLDAARRVLDGEVDEEALR